MSERILLMPDKMLRSGSAPVYNQDNQTIANIHYHYMSMTRKLEITDQNEQIISKGKMKMFSFRPTWIITDQDDQELGVIKQLFSFLSRRFVYTNHKGEEFSIDGNLRGRNFQIYKGDQQVIVVSSVSEFFTFRPHSYEVKILEEDFSASEAINLVEGIRTLVELSKSRN
jgi:uncharacterized protein YxjI